MNRCGVAVAGKRGEKQSLKSLAGALPLWWVETGDSGAGGP